MRLLPPEVKGVVIDTNMFLVPFQFGVDILAEIERLLPGVRVYTIPPVLRELRELLRGNLKERLGARIGLQLAERVEVIPVPEHEPADTALLRLAREGYAIATNDRELRRKIREAGGYTIFLREGNHLELG